MLRYAKMGGMARTGETRSAARDLVAASGREAEVRWWLLVAVVLFALSLRGPVAAVSPLLPELRSQFGLGGGPADHPAGALLRGRRPAGAVAGALAVGLAVLAALSLVGLLELPSFWPLLAAIGGLAVGASLGTATTLMVLRTRHASTTRHLSAMAQTGAYAIAACGPVAVGALHDASGGWTTPLIMLLAVAG